MIIGRVEKRGKDAEKQKSRGPEGPQQLGLGGSSGAGEGPFPAGWPSDGQMICMLRFVLMIVSRDYCLLVSWKGTGTCARRQCG